jgi:hypothetical protein
VPKASPPIWPSIASIGPAAARISSGMPSTQAPATRCATGSHSRFHVGMLACTHSLADQATASVAPAGKAVAGSSHSSASLTASVTAVRWAAVSEEVVAARRCCASCAARS